MSIDEVMIGNYVRYSDRNAKIVLPIYTGQILAINLGGLSFNPHEERWKHEDIVCPLVHCEGIELTPELLIEKCGFEKIDHINGYSFYAMKAKNQPKINIYLEGVCKTEWMGYYVPSHCKYLHQLQNLIYCLTGKALEVKI